MFVRTLRQCLQFMSNKPALRRRKYKAADQVPCEIETVEDRLVLSGVSLAADSAEADVATESVNTEWGTVGQLLERIVSTEYSDGLGTLAGEDRVSAREVSNAIAADDSDGTTTNDRGLTDLLWIWGQFIDHDIDLSEPADEAAPIEVPLGDPQFDPFFTGEATIDFNRTDYELDEDGVRQQMNLITAFIDGSVIYGSDAEREEALRSFTGGRLATSDGDLLPYNEHGLENAGGTSADLFLAGDIRANENVALASMHTIWVREHNRIADEIAAEDPSLTDDQIFEQARAVVTAELQAITYNEFLPALLGNNALTEYTGFDSTVNPNIANVFSTAAYRFGHSLLSTELLRLNPDGTTADEGNLPLQSAFFDVSQIEDFGIDSLLQGAAVNEAQELDSVIVDDVRNFLFGPPGAGGLDLVSLNIQRGRDHGLADYNQAREDMGLERVTSFSDITSDPELAASLEATYGSVDDIDVWVGGLAEDHLVGSSMGELFTTIIVDQFQRLRDGDANWYENVFSGQELREIENTSLADVIERNSDVSGLQDNVFFSPAVMQVDLSEANASDITIRSTDSELQIVDSRRGRVIESADLDAIDRLMVLGSDQRQNSILFENLDAAQLPGGIFVDAGDSRDTLRIEGTNAVDSFFVENNSVQVNGMDLEFSQVERVVLETLRGQDDVSIAEDITVDVRVNDQDEGRNDRRTTQRTNRQTPRTRNQRDAFGFMESLSRTRRRR